MGIDNSVATFWTVAQLREHIGEPCAANRLMRAVEKVCGDGVMTPNVGGTENAQDVIDVVCELIGGEKL